MSEKLYEHIEDVSAEHVHDEAHLVKLPRKVCFEEAGRESQYFVVTAGVVETPEYRAEETFVWCANPEGDVIEWTELPGSQRFTLDWATVAQEFAQKALNENNKGEQ